MIELYIWDSCPFCQKVLQAAEQMGLKEGREFIIVDGSPGSPGRLLVQQRGGKTMVPFLVDGPTAMYESNDIIDYLRNKFVK